MKHRLGNEKGIALGLFAVSVALAGVGIAFISIAQQTASLTREASEWTKAPGEITDARVVSIHGEAQPEVEYTYTVKDQPMKGNRLFLSKGPYVKVEPAEDGFRVTYLNDYKKPVTKEYRKGADVDVYYNPRLPKESVVNPIILKQLRGFLLIGLGAVALAMFLGVKSFLYDD